MPGSLMTFLFLKVQPTNRFAMFNDDDDGGMPPPQPQYHGRASEPAIR